VVPSYHGPLTKGLRNLLATPNCTVIFPNPLNSSFQTWHEQTRRSIRKGTPASTLLSPIIASDALIEPHALNPSDGRQDGIQIVQSVSLAHILATGFMADNHIMSLNLLHCPFSVMHPAVFSGLRQLFGPALCAIRQTPSRCCFSRLHKHQGTYLTRRVMQHSYS